MSHTFSVLLYHLVFATKNREPFLHPSLRDELYPYLAKIVRAERGSPLAIGGVEDHVHLLVRLKPVKPLPDLLRMLKAASSAWLRARAFCPPHFAWQEGYGAFTVSKSGAPAVSRYIDNQERHHRRQTFEEEWKDLLLRHGIEPDPEHPFGV